LLNIENKPTVISGRNNTDDQLLDRI